MICGLSDASLDFPSSVCLLITTVRPAKAVEPIEMPFGADWLWVRPKNRRRANWRHLTNTMVKSVRGLRCDVSLPLAVATCCLFAVENFAASGSRTRRRNRLSGTKLQRVPMTAVKPRTGHGGQCPGRGPRGLETSASPHSRIETYKTKTNASTIIRDQCQGRDRAFVETRRPIYKSP